MTNTDEAREFVEGVRDRFYVPPPMSVRQAVDGYVEHVGKQSGNAETIAFAKCALKPLVKARGDYLAANLSANALDAFLRDTEGRAMATRRSYWKCLMRFMAWLRRRGVLHKDIVAEYLRQRTAWTNRFPGVPVRAAGSSAGARRSCETRPRSRRTWRSAWR